MAVSVRSIQPEDKEEFIKLAKKQVEETLPHLTYEEDVVSFYFDYTLKQDSIHIFITFDDGVMTGFLVANIEPYLFRRGFLSSQEVIYVLPEYRNTRAGIMLLNHFETWSKARGVDETFVGIANGIEAERKLKFFERKEYERVGYFLRKIRNNEKITPSKL